jgi:hypothetical protein
MIIECICWYFIQIYKNAWSKLQKHVIHVCKVILKFYGLMMTLKELKHVAKILNVILNFELLYIIVVFN